MCTSKWSEQLGLANQTLVPLQIIGVDGEPTGMKAINYFGFNNGATMFDGLYAGSNSLTQDFGLTIYRLQVPPQTPAHPYLCYPVPTLVATPQNQFSSVRSI